MTVSEFTENPLYQSVIEKLQRAVAYLASLPLVWWRNLLIVFALLWCCHSFATLFWLVFPSPELPQPERLAAPPASGGGGSSTAVNVDVAALQAQNLFGELGETRSDIAGDQQTAALGDDVDAQETRLSIKLHGVVASFDPEYARAIIEDGKEQFLVRINEELPGNKGVKLARVMESKVILDNRGKYESLSLYNDDDFAAKGASRTQRPNNMRVARNGAGKNRAASSASKSNLAKRATVSKAQMPKSIGDVVRFSVHRENGAMVGYRVRPGRDRELFEQVGLKTNDVVTTVNGIRMDDPKQLKAVYQSLKTATSADLGVLRNGEELSINISVEGG